MCLSIPAKILSIQDNMAQASIGGSVVNASLDLVEDVKVGDYILIHTGFALEKISDKEAKKMQKMLDELEATKDEIHK